MQPRPALSGSVSGSAQSGVKAGGAGEETETVQLGDTVRAEDGVQVTFEQDAAAAADLKGEGLALFLAKGAAGPSAAAAPSAPAVPGTPPAPVGTGGGQLGAGLDKLGDWEQRGYGCAQLSPAGTVLLVPRAPAPNVPGDGTTGYCSLNAASTGKATWSGTGQFLGPVVYLPADAASAAQAQAQSQLTTRTVRVTVTPAAPTSVMSVDIDFQDGRGFQNVLSSPLPAPLPSAYNIGLAGCGCILGGGSTQIIREVVVTPAQTPVEVRTPIQTPTVPVAPTPTPSQVVSRAQSGIALVKRAQHPTSTAEAGDAIAYTFRVTNIGSAPLHSVFVDDPRIPAVSCPTGPLTAAASVTCSGTYTVTAADVAAGFVTNTATATAVRADDATTVTSEPSTVTVPLSPRPRVTAYPQRPHEERPHYDRPCHYTGLCHHAGPCHYDRPWSPCWHDRDRCHHKHHYHKHHHGRPCHRKHHRHHAGPGHHKKPGHHKHRHHKPRPREKSPLL